VRGQILNERQSAKCQRTKTLESGRTEVTHTQPYTVRELEIQSANDKATQLKIFESGTLGITPVNIVLVDPVCGPNA
jgi:hypothetical protein